MKLQVMNSNSQYLTKFLIDKTRCEKTLNFVITMYILFLRSFITYNFKHFLKKFFFCLKPTTPTIVFVRSASNLFHFDINKRLKFNSALF